MMHRNTKIIGIFSTLIVFVAMGAFAGIMYIIDTKKKVLEEERMAAAVAEAQYEQLASLVKLVKDTEQERTELASRILTEEGVVDFLSLIETMAREQGVTLATDALTVKDVSPQYEHLEVKVTFSGSYQAVTHVLRLFEVLPYQSSITGVVLTRTEAAEAGEGAWSAAVDFSVTKFKKQ